MLVAILIGLALGPVLAAIVGCVEPSAHAEALVRGERSECEGTGGALYVFNCDDVVCARHRFYRRTSDDDGVETIRCSWACVDGFATTIDFRRNDAGCFWPVEHSRSAPAESCP